MMVYRQNDSMRRIVGDQTDFSAFEQFVPLDLITFVNEGFKEVEGCVVPKSYTLNNVPLAPDENQSHAEADISKASVDDFLPSGTTVIAMVKAGLGFASILRNGLLSSGLQGPFKIIVTASDDPQISGCSVRFHRARVGQDWLHDDLNIYSNPTAILE